LPEKWLLIWCMLLGRLEDLHGDHPAGPGILAKIASGMITAMSAAPLFSAKIWWPTQLDHNKNVPISRLFANLGLTGRLISRNYIFGVFLSGGR
jgi:hypothetical protein